MGTTNPIRYSGIRVGILEHEGIGEQLGLLLGSPSYEAPVGHWHCAKRSLDPAPGPRIHLR